MKQGKLLRKTILELKNYQFFELLSLFQLIYYQTVSFADQKSQQVN